jgi:outer membrane biogenesis lipoprotein LolB
VEDYSYRYNGDVERKKFLIKENVMLSKTSSFRFFCVLALFALILAACGGAPKLSDQIIGKWEYTDPDLNATMTFDFQKDGKLTISAADQSIDATYSWEDADTIKLVVTLGEETDESMGDIKITGDTLTLTIDGESQDLTRVK